MSTREQTVQEFVVEAVANLYEDFPRVLEQVQRWARERGISVSDSDVVNALGRAIQDGYVQAFLLSAQPPYSKPVEFSPASIGELWFHATGKGKKLVSQLD